MKKISILLLFLATMAPSSHGQTVKFSYDACGNRIKREKMKEIVGTCQSGNLNKSVQEVFKEEFKKRVVDPVIENPDMLYKDYWLKLYQ